MTDVLTTATWFSQVYATLACGVVVLDPTGVVVAANAAAQEILGVALDDLHGLPVAAAFPLLPSEPALPSEEHPLLVTPRSGRPCRDLTLRITRPDGDERWLRADAAPMPAETGGTGPAGSMGAAGTAVQIVVSFVDVTIRQEAEERLRLLESVVVNANDAVLITEAWPFDQPGPRIVYVNEAFTRTTGYTSAEVLGRTPRLLQGPNSDRAALDTLRAALEGWQAVVVEVLNYRKDGTEFWVELSIVPVADAAGYITHWVSVQRDVTPRRQTDALRHQALHDALTDLPNRTLLHDRVALALRAAERAATPLALLLFDLDHFKEVNDTLGHHAGDQLLRAVAIRLVGTVRASDTVARLGGDEFAVLLPTADAEAAITAASTLLAALEPPFLVEGQRLEVGASIGVAVAPAHGADAAALLQHADVAMYVAKRGRSGYALYDADQDEHSLRRLALMGELRQAIAAGQLLLHYQPKVAVATGRLQGVEVLVRWPHPERGLIPPAEFIPLAEQTGVIGPLTHWVLDAALGQARAWRDQGLALPVAVNLSARLLQDPGVVDTIVGLLDAWGLDAYWLEIEITESAVMADPAGALAILTRLHDRGIRLSIDDFGTGYSSLAYLRRLPVDTIKIDQSFVRELAVNGDDAAIARAIVDLGHTLGLGVVAEGVEDDVTWARLTALGCDVAQGYHIGRPIPAEEVQSWVDRWVRRRRLASA